MGAILGGGVSPPPVPIAPPAAAPPTAANASVQATGVNAKARAAAAANSSGTVGQAGPQGLSAGVPTTDATLLGATR
jgi:hypothetical protein